METYQRNIFIHPLPHNTKEQKTECVFLAFQWGRNKPTHILHIFIIFTDTQKMAYVDVKGYATYSGAGILFFEL